MPYYLSLSGSAPEAGQIAITDSMGVELTVVDISLKTRDSALTPMFGVGVGGTVLCTPKISGGSVFFGACDKNIYAVDALTGTQRWRFPTGDVVIEATCADRIVYAAGYDRHLYALSEAGTLLWSFEAQDCLAAPPAISRTAVYVVCKDGHLYAVDRVTGKLLWKFYDGTPSFGQPGIEGDMIYIGFYSGKCYALRSDGTVKWSFTARGLTGSATIGTHIYFPSFDGNIYALDRDGSLVWTLTTGEKNLVWKPMIEIQGTLIFTLADNKIGAARDGTLVWSVNTDSPVYTCPAVVGGRLYAVTIGGNLLCINSQTGRVLWKKSLPLKPVAISTDGEHLFIACYDCKVVCASLDGDLLWTAPTSLSFVSPINFESVTPQTLTSAQLQQAQELQRETEAYKGKVSSDTFSGGSVYSGLNIGYASSFNQYTKRTKYVK